MARMRRSDLPDGIYHVVSRGVGRMTIYRDDDDRRLFLALLGFVTRTMQWRCHALCLMGNHYHLVVEATQPVLSAAMQKLNGAYAVHFNGRYGRWGHVFGHRFGAKVIESAAYLAEACTYVVNNPVRAGLCDRPSDWPWSGSRFGLDV